MKNLLTIEEQDIVPGSPVIDTSAFRKREAARAVLLGDDGQVYLLNVSKHGYHMLPGGGIDDGETVVEALERELMEEVGCRAEILAELGTVVEYRNYDNGGSKQTSYCYLAKHVGDQTELALEEEEIEEGIFGERAKNIDEAIQLLEDDKPDNLEGKFIQRRDITLLKTAKESIHSTS